MSEHEKFLARMTEPLSVDPELQLDVKQELRAHLNDSAADFREAGMDDLAADAEAVKAMGPPDELSGELWVANRRRIRIRGLLRWAARVALIPGAILVIAFLVIPQSGNLMDIEPLADELTEEQMFILRGDPAAQTPQEEAKSISDRWPENPVYYGNYVASELNQQDAKTPAEDLAYLTPMLQRAETLDPQNAFYNFVRASLMIEAACTVQESKTLFYTYLDLDPDAESKTQQKSCFTTTIQDDALFQKGLTELRKGLAKPHYAIPTFEMVKVRKSIFPKAQTIFDIHRQIFVEMSVLISGWSEYRNMSKSLLGYALMEAKKGNATTSLKTVREVEQFANRIGAESRSLLELLVANANYKATLGQGTQIGKTLGRVQLAADYQKRLDENNLFLRELRNSCPDSSNERVRSAGAFWSVLLPVLPGYQVDCEPMRTAEQFLVNKLGLLVLLVILTLLAIVSGGVTLLELLRRNDRPVLLFVGWRRLGRICLGAIVLPIGLYAAYVRLVTVGPNAYGLNFTGGRVILEMIFVGSIITVLLVGMSFAAIRRRADELGLTVPQPLTYRRRWFTWTLAGLFVIGTIVYVIGWWAGSYWPSMANWTPIISFMDPISGSERIAGPPSPEAMLLGLTILAFLLIWIFREWVGLIKKPLHQFRRSVYRSLVPILAATVILVGLLCGVVLNRAETSAVGRITGPAGHAMENEVNNSDYSKMRDRFEAGLKKAAKPL